MIHHRITTSLFVVVVVVVVVVIAFVAVHASAQTAPSDILTRATMAQAEKQLQDPTDDNARFALGIAQFLRAVERLGGTMNKFGLRHDELTQELPFARLPVPKNPNPQPVGYDDVRAMFQTWLDDMDRVRQTLSQIRAPEKVKLELPIGLVHLDLNGDDQAGEEESLWRVFEAVNGRPRGTDEQKAKEFVIALDGGDVHWLIGYTHLLSALPEIVLAYDEQELFNRTAHLVFANPKTPYDYLKNGPKTFDVGIGVDVFDAIAFVHLLNFPVKEPQRMESARQHLKSMLDESRKSWDLILKETDDDREWIPNPHQHSVIGAARVTDDQVRGWQTFLDEADALLDGKKLLPFWRANDGRGVNLRRAFAQPQTLDVVLWLQGTAATPYLENGDLTRGDTWRHLVGLFQGDFVSYAIWFN